MTAVADPGVSIDVASEFDLGRVTAALLRYCAAQRLPVSFAAHVATAASELASNLWLHADQGGRIRLTLLRNGAARGVELRADDDGPGIADVAQAMVEGYSSAGGLGCGLPGVQRLMDEFEIDSAPGLGTRIVARKWLPPCR